MLANIEAALEDLRQGKMVILTDDPEREDEGDLIFPAEIITPDVVNFMIRNGSGIVCLSLTSEQSKQLGLSYMVEPSVNTSSRGTPFTVSIEASKGVTTGVSAKDRATTILAAVNQSASPMDIVKPGHVFPLVARAGGVLERAGHTEGALDLVRLAGFSPAAVLCEVMNPDGTMARGQELKQFAQQHHLKSVSIDDIITYRRRYENFIADEAKAYLPLQGYGDFSLTVIKEKFSTKEHLVLSKPCLNNEIPLIRIHSSCVTGDLFGSERCDCKMQFDYALQQINQQGGLLIYLDQEGRGIGLFNKIKAYGLQENGFDTVEANQELGLPIDAREYYLAANILRNRHIQQIRLLTNNPHKITNLQKYGITNIEREAFPIFTTRHNQHYLQTKKQKLNHFSNEVFSL